MATAPRAHGNRSVIPQSGQGGGLAAAEPSIPDIDDGEEDVHITIGPADSAEVKKAAMVGGASVETDEAGNTVVNFNPVKRPGKGRARPVSERDGFNANLAEKLDESVLDAIATEVLDGIRVDEESRAQQISTYTDNMDMLGLRIERGGGGESQSVSNVRHPVLLESIVKFQSAASAEMLPAAGPCKVVNDGGDSEAEDEVAMALEKDFNWYLTKVATEYYPDTDRANFYLGYGGCIFKKIYKDPIRRRPVSEAVYIPDLIVSNDVTDIQNALRVTHVLRYLKSEVKRMQNMRVWRKVEMVDPVSKPTTTQMKEASISGVNPAQQRPQDVERVIYECYTELWLGEWDSDLDEANQPEGLPIPYRVTIDVESRKVLEIRRDWKERDALWKRKKHFVKFGLIPGLGFYDLGFLHLLGNQTKALTAIWRILVDAGMFSNFPGGVMVQGVRLSNTVIRPNPGEWVPVQTGPQQDISKAFMPLPYKEPSAVLLELAQHIEEEAMRMGSNVQLEVGEGRTNIPVGTIMAQIEQQTQVMQAVHKRLHRAQAEELEALLDLFREDPPMLTRFFGDKIPERQWITPQEFSNRKLVPASDPNVPAQVHRIMLAVALTMLAAQNTALYDQQAVQKRVLQMINVQNPDELLMTPEKQAALAQSQGAPPPDPKVLAAQITQQTKVAEAAAKQQTSAQDLQAKALEAGSQLQERTQESQDRQADRVSRETVAQIQQHTQLLKDHATASTDAADIAHQHKVSDIDAAKKAHDAMIDRATLAHEQQVHAHQQQMDQASLAADQQAQAHQQQMDQAGLATQQQGQAHDQAMAREEAQGGRTQMAHDQAMDREEVSTNRSQVQHDRQMDHQEAARGGAQMEHDRQMDREELKTTKTKTKADIAEGKASVKNEATKIKKGLHGSGGLSDPSK